MSFLTDEERQARRAIARQRLSQAILRLAVIEVVREARAAHGDTSTTDGEVPSGGVEETPAAGRWGSAAPEGERAGQLSDPPAGEQGEEEQQAEGFTTRMAAAFMLQPPR
jgi:hypothetical protein